MTYCECDLGFTLHCFHTFDLHLLPNTGTLHDIDEMACLKFILPDKKMHEFPTELGIWLFDYWQNVHGNFWYRFI